MKLKKIRNLVLLTMVGALLTACGNPSEPANETVTVQEETEQITEKETQPVTITIGESNEGKIRSKLTGEWVEEEIGNRRPIAVMLNNIKEAVPQAGIEKAGIVYEAPVEGGLTRLMGIFENYDDLEKIGSVRSSRLYYVYFAKEFDAVYVHFGQAIYAEPLLNSQEIQNLNGLKLDGTTFYRTTDRVRPHNAYTSGDRVNEAIAQYGYRKDYEGSYQGHYKFNTKQQEIELTNGYSAVKVVPGYAINKPWFDYNPSDKLYYRYQYNDKQIDETTGNQLAYKNIIMQYVDYYDYGDGYLNITLTGNGKGKFITNGKAIDITWKKDAEFGITRYYDLNGNEIELNQGKTWVCIIQNDRVGHIEIE